MSSDLNFLDLQCYDELFVNQTALPATTTADLNAHRAFQQSRQLWQISSTL